MRNLKGHRQRAGLTQVQLSERSGLKQTHISKLERGAVADPSFSTVLRLADALGVTAEVLAADAPVIDTADLSPEVSA